MFSKTKVRLYNGSDKKGTGSREVPLSHSNQLERLASKSARVLMEFKSTFPFTLFPDEIIVDETKVSIHTHYFFATKQVRSVEFKDIFNVTIQQGVVFANMTIADRFFSQEPINIPYLKKNDAIKARRLIQGLILASKEGIKIHDLPYDELMQKLERIGQSR